MSETDSFIEEVSEEVRRERLFRLIRKWGWIPALLVLVLVGGASWNEYNKAQKETQAQALGDSLMAAMEITDPEARAEALATIGAQGSEARAVVAMITAAAHAQTGDVPDADAALAAVSTDGDVSTVYRDLSRYKRLVLAGNSLPENERLALIDSLSAAGAPFRTLALEQRAIVHLEAGEKDRALEIYETLLTDSEATPDLSQRARQMILVLSGPRDAT